eukprot:2073197-Prymnesium_polylepis.1
MTKGGETVHECAPATADAAEGSSDGPPDCSQMDRKERKQWKAKMAKEAAAERMAAKQARTTEVNATEAARAASISKWREETEARREELRLAREASEDDNVTSTELNATPDATLSAHVEYARDQA